MSSYQMPKCSSTTTDQFSNSSILVMQNDTHHVQQDFSLLKYPEASYLEDFGFWRTLNLVNITDTWKYVSYLNHFFSASILYWWKSLGIGAGSFWIRVDFIHYSRCQVGIYSVKSAGEKVKNMHRNYLLLSCSQHIVKIE